MSFSIMQFRRRLERIEGDNRKGYEGLIPTGFLDVGYSAERGKIIARENDYQLIDRPSWILKGVPWAPFNFSEKI
jgi:hypothetical protein